MDKTTFNKIFFIKPSNEIFHQALYFSKAPKLSLSELEFLFFANHSATSEGLSLLAFAEEYNRKHTFTNQWIEDLSKLQDENDWYMHQHKLNTQFLYYQHTNPKSFELFKNKDKKLASEDKETLVSIKNATTTMNNLNYLAKKNTIGRFSHDHLEWQLWQNLCLIAQESYESIKDEIPTQKIEQILAIRSKPKFFEKINAGTHLSEKQIRFSYEINAIIAKSNLKNKIDQKTQDSKSLLKKATSIFKI